MAEILLFHHAGGLTAGVTAFADTLRASGHTVHAPDLFGGQTFDDVHEGVAFAERLGREALSVRAAAAAADLPTELVYLGMSLGCALAAEQLLDRPGARGAVFLYGAVMPSWWGRPWPDGVPAQAHLTADDPWREPEAEAGFVREVPQAELRVYPGAGHLFADTSSADHEPAAAAEATERILAFLAGR